MMKLQSKRRRIPEKNSIEIHLMQQQIDEYRNQLETCEKTIKEQKIHLLRFKEKYSGAKHQIELLTDQISVLKKPHNAKQSKNQNVSKHVIQSQKKHTQKLMQRLRLRKFNR